MYTRQGSPIITRALVEATASRRSWLEQWKVEHDRLSKLMRDDLLQASDDLRIATLYRDNYGRQYTENPTQLLKNTIAAIRAKMLAYEKQYPANQNLAVRLCLVEMDKRIHIIEQLPFSTVKEAQDSYIATVGLLWTMLDKADKVDQPLAQSILYLLCSNRIHREDAKEAYQQACGAQPELARDLSEPELNHILQNRFHEAYRRLSTELCNDRYLHSVALLNLHDAACKVRSSIKYEAENSSNKTFDIKLHTRILDMTAQLMRQPENPDLMKEYQQLTALNQNGVPSVTRQISGVMLTFAGAALVVASVILDGASVGLAVAATVAIKVSGMLMVCSGVGLFASGCRSGSSRSMSNFIGETKCFNQNQRHDAPQQQASDERTPLLVGMKRI